MKRLLHLLHLLGAGLVFFGLAAPCRADLPWQVDVMRVALAIEPGGRLRVEETIAFNLGHERHHHLTRRIALASPADPKRRMSIRIHAVTDGRGNPWPARVREWDGWIEIRIGSGETFLTGAQDLLLVYDVEGAMREGPARDELHWDVTGGPWDGPIVDLMVTVALPPGTSPEMIDGGARTMLLGEEPRAADLKTIDAQQVRFMLPRGLRMRETMRISLSWPAELLPRPGPLARLGWLFLRHPWWILPVAAWIAIGGRRLAERRRRSIAAPAGPPPSPIEIGLREDGMLRPRHLVATVLDLARRGALRIERTARVFAFRRGDAVGTDDAPPLSGPEVLLLDALAPDAGVAPAPDLPLRLAAALEPIARAARDRMHAGDRRWANAVRQWRTVLLVSGASLGAGVLLALLTGAPFPAALIGIALAAACAGLIAAIAGLYPAERSEVRSWPERLLARGEGATPDPQSFFEAFLPAAVAVGAAPAFIRDHAPAVRRPSYFPAAAAPDGAGATDGLADRLVADLDVLGEPFRQAVATLP